MSTETETDKLLKVLNLFLLPDYNVVSTTYLDLLLTHISKPDKSGQQNNEQRNLLRKWIIEAIETWSGGQVKPCQAVAVFTIKLIGILSKDENIFDQFDNEGIYEKMSSIFELDKAERPASFKMAYTSMLVDIISHKIGRRWVISKGIWKDVIKFAQVNHTLYVTRESHKFIYTLLNEESLNKKFCKEVILVVSEPLVNNYAKVQPHAALEAVFLDKNATLCSTLDLITSIVENTMFQSLENDILDMFEETVDLMARVRALIEVCISTKFFHHISKLWTLLCLQIIKKGARNADPNFQPTMETWEEFGDAFCSVQTLLIERKYIIEIMKVQQLALIYWKKFNSIKSINTTHEHKFEYQAITLMMTPLGTTLKRGYLKNEFFEMFIDKIFDITCLPVQRLAYLIRDMLLKGNLPVEQICKSSIEMVIEIVDIMDRDAAVIAFQSLCYSLKHCVPMSSSCEYTSQTERSSAAPMNENRRRHPSIFNGDPVVDNPGLLATILNALAVLTKKYQFKWQDCVETICLLSLAQAILNHTGAISNLCVKALQLCNLAIHNFMPPTLALLVESDASMNSLGPTLYKRLHDPNWEVRDSVLEVLITIATISEDKYPAFQDFLLANNFLPFIIEISTTDDESYVRASAIKFIASTVRINQLWDRCLANANLPDKFIKLLKEESEAIVRREAADLINELYVYRKWPKATIECMSSVMAEAAVLDLHWEVKINALNFWKHFIKSHFTDQGMLDGSFPHVTFSKEHRKIVTLDEIEIRNRLNKALDEVAKHRCLGVLLATLENDSDLEVSRTAANIIKRLKTFIHKYKLDESPPRVHKLPKDYPTIDSCYKRPPPVNISPEAKPTDKSSGVIDQIIDENDANLLASIYENSLKMDSDSATTKQITIDKLSQVTRRQFLTTISDLDVDAYIEERSRWLKDYTVCFDSVLEDILTVYEQKDANTMDCY